ncbi:MAG: hypothetical protein JNM56_09100 [Planctomycetia bacterium]|nr:hypothetical protein [Planctomycetia bacterium]
MAFPWSWTWVAAPPRAAHCKSAGNNTQRGQGAAQRLPRACQATSRFDGGTNLDPKKDKHMHAATLTFASDNHLKLQGEGWENGAPLKEMCCGLKLVREK